MLQRPSYRRKWEAKKAWYTAHGIRDESAGGGENGTLIITRDGADGSISSAEHRISHRPDSWRNAPWPGSQAAGSGDAKRNVRLAGS